MWTAFKHRIPQRCSLNSIRCRCIQIANLMRPTWGLPGSCRPQMGPMLAPWILLSGYIFQYIKWAMSIHCHAYIVWSKADGDIRSTGSRLSIKSDIGESHDMSLICYEEGFSGIIKNKAVNQKSLVVCPVARNPCIVFARRIVFLSRCSNSNSNSKYFIQQ